MNVGDMEHGSVTADKGSAAYGSTVTLTVKPEEGYTVGTVTVTDRNGKAVEGTDNGDGTYSFPMPNDAVTVTVTAVFNCDGASDCPSEKFTDVDQNKRYHEGVDYAILKDLMKGTGLAAFEPETFATRGMAVILHRYAEYKGYDLTADAGLTGYTDADSVSVWASTAMPWAVGKGLIGGTSETDLTPAGKSTRAQVATILMRFCEKIVK